MIRTLSLLILVVFSSALGGCAPTSLRYESNGWKEDPASAEASDVASPQMTQDGARSGSPIPPEPVEDELDWSDLTQMAREHQRRREYERAQQRLDQAAVLVAGLPPTHASRRAVFGIRARFAEQLGRLGEVERADALADQLLAEAEAEPDLAGASFVSLAVSLAERRAQSAKQMAETGGETEAGEGIETPSQLPLLDIALRTAQAGSASRQRFTLAARVAEDAYNQDRVDIARIAIDQALADIAILSPNNLSQIALLLLQRSRIATANGDFAVAIADATRATGVVRRTARSPSPVVPGRASTARKPSASRRSA
jgi:hypothetical protein